MAKLLNEISGLPQITTPFGNWTVKIDMLVITQEVIDGFVTDFEKRIKFEGIIQPLSERKLQLKPEGQRSFEWLQIHCKSNQIAFKPGDKIVHKMKRYKIMGVFDYSLNNFSEYHAVRDYQEEKKK